VWQGDHKLPGGNCVGTMAFGDEAAARGTFDLRQII
jgi:hypothetical protein